MIQLYGIKNCDTVKKARRWLDNAAKSYEFNDFRDNGIHTDLINTWLTTLGHDTLVNKRSTTWKQLNESQQQQAFGQNAAELIAEYPTLIKRPVLVRNSSVYVGFKADQYAEIFSK